MSDIVGRLRACANGIGSFKSPKGDYGLCDDAADRIQQLEYEKDLLTEGVAAYRARIEQLERENAELREALKPFATAGRIIDGPFGPALFAEDDMAFQSGCAWSENGERKTITWGDFCRARRLAEQEGTE